MFFLKKKGSFDQENLELHYHVYLTLGHTFYLCLYDYE